MKFHFNMKATRRHLLLLVFFTLCVLLVKFIQIRYTDQQNYVGFEVQISDNEINPRQLLNLNDFRFVLQPNCKDMRPLIGEYVE